MKRLVVFFALIFVFSTGLCLERDSVLNIKSPEELYHLNTSSSILKDPRGNLALADILRLHSEFQPLQREFYDFHNDREINAYWVKSTVKNTSGVSLNYIFYFFPRIDTVITFMISPDSSWSRTAIGTMQPTESRPLFISQELAFPVVLQPGTTHIYFRFSNSSEFIRQLGSIMINLAEEKGFLNYFLEFRFYQGIALGMLIIMLVFHVFIYFFFRDKTYLIFVINIFFTIIYLLLRKQYLAEVDILAPVLPALRYLHDPVAVFVFFTAILFSQSFLDTRREDPIMHNIMNFFLILQIPVLLCMVFLQQLFLMNQLSIYFGLLAGLAVIVASIRSYWRGNRKALYVFWGFLILFLVPIIYIIPMPGYLHFRNNEADVNYFGEALRSLIFAVGIADRFYGLKKEVVKAQIEKQKMFYENEKRINEDRERIARELHDNIGSQLTLIALRINKLRGDHGEESEQHKVYNQTNIVISQLRDTIWTMDRKVITVGDLANRIRSQLWNLRIDPVMADVTLPEELTEIQIPHFIAIGIHRIVQESTHLLFGIPGHCHEYSAGCSLDSASQKKYSKWCTCYV